MTIEAKIICDSQAFTAGPRLTTFVLRYPRFIHAEFMTHRMFSRNASSSRAIPIEKMIEIIINDPAMPIYWGKNQSGMQAKEELDAEKIAYAKSMWLAAMNDAVANTKVMLALGLHKQITNRILEPWQHITVVCSATTYKNFFKLRCHPDAQPEIAELARQMRDLYNSTEPKETKFHLPFIKDDELLEHDSDTLIKCSVARCARVSYLNHDGTNPSIEKDIVLHDRLCANNPGHFSPFEHVAEAQDYANRNKFDKNFQGWVQYRSTFKHESGLL
jgi:thymidylate synthase ThyX